MRRLLILLAAVATLSVSSSAGAATTGIKITKTGFSPKSVSIAFGDTVTWTNTDTADHQVVADNGSFASPILKHGQTYSFTFKTAGRFPYHDAIRSPSFDRRWWHASQCGGARTSFVEKSSKDALKMARANMSSRVGRDDPESRSVCCENP